MDPNLFLILKTMCLKVPDPGTQHYPCLLAHRQDIVSASFGACSAAAGLLAMAALHGVELAEASHLDLVRLEMRTLCAIRRPTRPSRAKEFVCCLPSPGHRTSPVMPIKYEQLGG